MSRPKKINKEDKNKESKEIKIKKRNKVARLRGMKDILFEEYKYWDLVIKKAKELSRAYSFSPIDIPILEFEDLYEKSSGRGSDIVNKEMYSFVDKSGEKIALRPEATPGIVRAFIEHGLFNLPQPVKTFWFGPLFRHDRPQAGRYRQHSQINFDIFGEESSIADFLLILLAYNFFRELQIEVQVQVNSLGCPECSKEFLSKLNEFYRERGKKSKLCNDCKKRIIKNPLRLLDCKEKCCQEIREGIPQMLDYLCDPCRDHFIKVLEYLDELNIPYNLNSSLVRGLDYYNRTVFEFWEMDENGTVKENISLGGGGRYDNLMEFMGGRPTPACGFGVGVERTILKVKEKNIPISESDENIIFLAQLGDQARRKIFSLFEELRRSGIKVRQALTKDSLKAQLEEANRVKARFTLVLGQKEVMDKTIMIRDMESGVQEVIDYKKVKSEIERRLRDEEKNK